MILKTGISSIINNIFKCLAILLFSVEVAEFCSNKSSSYSVILNFLLHRLIGTFICIKLTLFDL